MENSLSTLVGIPSRTQAHVSQVIKARVKPGVLPGEAVWIRFRVRKGLSEATTFEVRALTKLHVAAKVEIKYNKTPKIRGAFGVRRNHKVKVKLTNSSRSKLDLPFKIRLIPGLPETDIKVLKGEQTYPKIKTGKSSQKTLVYEIPNDKKEKR